MTIPTIDIQTIGVITTLIAVIAALVVPFIQHHLDNKPKNSKLKFVDIRLYDQGDDENYARTIGKPTENLLIGRITIRNDGKHLARNVEAYIEKIVKDGEERANYLPLPLTWTHGQINPSVSTRNILPNQTVLLDVISDYDMDGDEEDLRIATSIGQDAENFRWIGNGVAILHLVIYQESGEILRQKIRVERDGTKRMSEGLKISLTE